MISGGEGSTEKGRMCSESVGKPARNMSCKKTAERASERARERERERERKREKESEREREREEGRIGSLRGRGK